MKMGRNLANGGLIHLVKAEWDEAFDDAAAALRLRESVSHARGVANSLYLMGRARCAAGRHEEARAAPAAQASWPEIKETR